MPTARAGRSTQRPEGVAQLLGEDLRLLPGGEVPALLDPVVVNELRIRLLRPALRSRIELVREDGDTNRDLDALDVEEGQMAAPPVRQFMPTTRAEAEGLAMEWFQRVPGGKEASRLSQGRSGLLSPLIRQELAVEDDLHSVPLLVRQAPNREAEVDRAHDPVPELLVDQFLQRRAIDLNDLV